VVTGRHPTTSRTKGQFIWQKGHMAKSPYGKGPEKML
jgi:hypothetical protein